MCSYDKPKPFGFAIHGAIDGFSRRILWLEVAPSNNNPAAVAKYFVDYVHYRGGTLKFFQLFFYLVVQIAHCEFRKRIFSALCV